MKFLVTGATGLVGGNVVHEILSKYPNADVMSLGRNAKKLDSLRKIGSKTLLFDMSSEFEAYEQLAVWGGNGSIWIHCAAAVTGAPNNQLEEININGTTKLVTIAEKCRVSKFVLISSIAIYGLHSHRDNGFSENDPKNPQSKYGKSKLGQEMILEKSNLNYLIFRPPFVGGPGDVNVLPAFYHRMENQKMPSFSKKGYFGYVDARDIAKAIISAVNLDVKREVYNVQGTPLQLDEFINIIGKITGLNPPYGKTYPYVLGMAAGTIMDIIGKIQRRSKDRSISRYRIRSLTSNRKLDTTKAKTEINFDPYYNIEQSITDWYESYKPILNE